MSESEKNAPEKVSLGKNGKQPSDGAKARAWWENLQPSKSGEERARGGNRAALARLRRCSTWVEAATEPEMALLFRQIGRRQERRLPRVAVLAAVLAHVRSDEASNLASSVGSKGGR
jgi:CRISPR system Cascade subunit CasB